MLSCCVEPHKVYSSNSPVYCNDNVYSMPRFIIYLLCALSLLTVKYLIMAENIICQRFWNSVFEKRSRGLASCYYNPVISRIYFQQSLVVFKIFINIMTWKLPVIYIWHESTNESIGNREIFSTIANGKCSRCKVHVPNDMYFECINTVLY